MITAATEFWHWQELYITLTPWEPDKIMNNLYPVPAALLFSMYLQYYVYISLLFGPYAAFAVFSSLGKGSNLNLVLRNKL